ncbi:hypothetical protein JTE90_017941 [Oedothorax gibbosus]|uniref:Shootin-1 n=1 Tax=Oedothorax gibbosus TaxID=931172 RepID=A0AAV6V9T7_9ARAC|nr:hypothetical protein JTE90_017941 [Oedothorax gibbosus]
MEISESVIDEYSVLKLKCDLEVEAATEASKRATKYFEENKKLKGSKILEFEDNCSDVYDNIPNNDYDELPSRRQKLESISELDMLNNLASELRTEIASLKVQLEKEIEIQNALKEELEIAKSLYEQEVEEHNDTRKKVGSHQMDSNGSENESPVSKSLETSIDKSTMTLEQVQDLNADDCSNAKNTAEDFHSNSIYLELSEQVESFRKQNDHLSVRIRELEKENQKFRAETSASMSLPIPPPPPPPPPPSFNPIKSLITFIHNGKKSGKTKIKIEDVETEREKAMSEMINVIKKGQVRLKPTPKLERKRQVISAQSPKTEETALGEMKSILPTLKKKGIAAKESEDKKKLEDMQESQQNVSISSEVVDELKVLLRKRSLKSITDQNACALSVAGSSEESLVGHEAECHIYSPSNLKLKEENESNSTS